MSAKPVEPIVPGKRGKRNLVTERRTSEELIGALTVRQIFKESRHGKTHSNRKSQQVRCAPDGIRLELTKNVLVVIVVIGSLCLGTTRASPVSCML